MDKKQTILIVDDNDINRNILANLLQEEYEIIQAENGNNALDKVSNKISAILLNLAMPTMDSYDFLKAFKKTPYYGIPAIVITEDNTKENEKNAFNLGAWDFIPKPYDVEILKCRLQCSILKSESETFKKLKHLSEHDGLTGIYNRSKFFIETKEMLKAYPNYKFAFIRLDVDHFSLINTFYGNAEGDKLLKYIANQISSFVEKFDYATYGRIEADQFAICCIYDDIVNLQNLLSNSCQTLKKYPLDFEIILTFGIYVITDRSISVRQMLDNANLAAKHAKGHYSNNIAFYDAEMGQQLIAEQEIINEMNQALEEEQFCVYIQPKYDLSTNLPAGGEVLVRWNHPKKGKILPGLFIPVFEKNGFIAKLDHYVWDKACSLLAEWKKSGLPVLPISVNVSRVHLYNPQLADILCEITNKHNVSRELLNLELTESIYTEHASIIQESIYKLHNAGFTVMMDDFGSGYSSLNILKDVEFDVLKIDMRFFENSQIKGRSENIVASIVRMAKWLGIPIIAEGVEKKDQVDFLYDIGCEYVQGYYFAKPMPVNEYKELINSNASVTVKEKGLPVKNEFWDDNTKTEVLFSTIPQPIILFEFSNGRLQLIRVNKTYHDMFGYNDIALNSQYPEKVLQPKYVNVVWEAFYKAIENKDAGECEYLRKCSDGRELWIHLHIKYINQIGNKHIFLGTLWDITSQVQINQELQHYKNILGITKNKQKAMLIVDDVELNRELLKDMFEEKYKILQAANGAKAIETIKQENYEIDIILLDLIMPEMDGTEFLQYKKEDEKMRDIPVVIITTDVDPIKQVNMLAFGVCDYVAKPFVKETVIKRIENVQESFSRFAEITKEYNRILELSKTDNLTGVYNRREIEAIINHHLQFRKDVKHGFLILDIDDFKTINDTYGHICGDEVLKIISENLQKFFRAGDAVGRLGGDEFIAFMPGVSNKQKLLEKANELCDFLNKFKYTDEKLQLSVSIGVSLSNKSSNFIELYDKADQALYEAKQAGKKQARLYEE